MAETLSKRPQRYVEQEIIATGDVCHDVIDQTIDRGRDVRAF